MDDKRTTNTAPLTSEDPNAGLLDEAAALRVARRKLLKIGVYAAPLIIGTLVARKAQAGSCPPCEPNVCDPTICGPP